MVFVQVNLTTPYLFFIVLSSRVSPNPEKPSITERVIVEKQLLLKVIREFKEYSEFKEFSEFRELSEFKEFKDFPIIP